MIGYHKSFWILGALIIFSPTVASKWLFKIGQIEKKIWENCTKGVFSSFISAKIPLLNFCWFNSFSLCLSLSHYLCLFPSFWLFLPFSLTFSFSLYPSLSVSLSSYPTLYMSLFMSLSVPICLSLSLTVPLCIFISFSFSHSRSFSVLSLSLFPSFWFSSSVTPSLFLCPFFHYVSSIFLSFSLYHKTHIIYSQRKYYCYHQKTK